MTCQITRPNYPSYYKDCLDFFRGPLDLTKIPWTTSDIRAEITKRSTHEPNSYRDWVSLGLTNFRWELIWPTVHTSYASGFQQDIHYLLLHNALYTNLFLSKFQDPTTDKYCDFCRASGNHREEGIFHLFFQCKPANQLWKKVLPLLKLILNSNTINRTNILFNKFPTGTVLHAKKLALSVIQIIIQRIWLSRNDFKHKSVHSDPDICMRIICHNVMNMVKAKFNIFKRRNKLRKFCKLFCYNQNFCQVDTHQRLHFPFLQIVFTPPR